MTLYARWKRTSASASTPSASSGQRTLSLRVWLLALGTLFLLCLGACANTSPLPCPPLPQVTPTAAEVARRPSPLQQLMQEGLQPSNKPALR